MKKNVYITALALSTFLLSCNKETLSPTNGVNSHDLILKRPPALTTATGTFTKLTNLPGAAFSSVMILLTDGTVAVKTTSGGTDGNGNTWLRLTPDATGSYVNGTWSSTIAPMNFTRHDFSSQLLPDGRLYVAGGEYGTGGSNAEIYDPIANTWTNTAPPPASLGFIADASTELLNDGTILQNFVGSNGSMGCSIYNPTTNTWGPVFNSLGNLDEGHFVQLSDQSILNIDLPGTTAERYIPALGQWVADTNPVVNLYSMDGEMGAGFLLPNNKVFYMGANGKTIYYNPSNATSPGTWTAGPNTPNGLGADDGGAVFMNNGKILYAIGPVATATKAYQAPTSFYEFDYTANTFKKVTAPGGTSTYNFPTFESNFLQLPDGSILFATMYSATGYYIYKPGGTQIAAGVPTITNVTGNGTRNLVIAGTLLRGINTGAAYGDDSQPYSNYPIVRLTSGSKVYYARTTNIPSTGTSKFTCTIPSTVPSGTYAMSISVNGFISASTNISF